LFTGLISRRNLALGGNEVRNRATATTAAAFLDTVGARMPFTVRAVQVDGGSEFHATFEAGCQRRGLYLFVLPPRSPKLNGAVERPARAYRGVLRTAPLRELYGRGSQP
jgi:hypothetical protein